MQKLVVLSTPKNTVNAREFSPHKYYGVETGASRAMLTRDSYESGNFRTVCVDEFTSGNNVTNNAFETQSFTSLVENLTKLNWRVYEFTSLMELVDWAGRKS